jgi:hypothetical protein
MTINNLPTHKKWRGVIALLVGTLAFSNPANALTLLGNYPGTDFSLSTIGGTGTGVNFQRAIGFDLPNGNNYDLDNIRLRLSVYNTASPTNPDIASLTIFADPLQTSTSPIGLLTALSSNGFFYPNSSSNNQANFTFTPRNSFTFLANTRYWLLIDADLGFFRVATSDTENAPTGIATNPLVVESDDNGSSYSSRFFNTFEINATAVTPVPFEFNPAFGLGVIGGFLLVRKRLKKKSTKL